MILKAPFPLRAICLALLLLAGAGRQATAQPEELPARDFLLVGEEIARDAESVPKDQPSSLARGVAFDPNDTLIPLTAEVRRALDPDQGFSLGLDRLVRTDYAMLDHKRILVVTSRLAVDSEGRHLLETLLPLRKPMVQRVLLFNDELPPPARTTALDRILGAYPEVRVFERSPRNLRATPSMLEGVDVVLVDIPTRGGQFHAESGFLCGLLLDASVAGLKIVLLDRPVPVSGHVFDGPVADAHHHGSANAFYPLLPVMGLTVGEVATLINNQFGLDANLEVVRLLNWRRDAGYEPLRELLRRRGVDPSRALPEWSAYVPASVAAAHVEIIRDLLPAGRVLAAETSGGDTEPSLILDPDPLAAEEFAQQFSRLQVAGLSAAAVERPGGGPSAVRLVASGTVTEPVFAGLALWSIWAGADASVLPERGDPGSFGSAGVFDALREGRHPRDIQRGWRNSPAFAELDTRRKSSLQY